MIPHSTGRGRDQPLRLRDRLGEIAAEPFKKVRVR
jgi:hypothetical protein